MPTIRVTINGTEKNHWHGFGLTCNPFPQLAKAEYDAGERRVRRLDGDPIQNTTQIRTILRGCSDEFINLCCRLYEPGKRVSFDVEWKDEP